ncbi:hypothetical protein SPI_03609 [Niveomyces insectorum RCEF 264]|uniref:Uncharacterized protein n=1 Tax=Niveomyces insectorum RCEF 264 TaxID=1081102 RepID=A0A167W7W7_9HYPO|nr:hypothetical protein SPI_03609 [Niveomyces insectorum RCEF 264]
MTSLNTIDQFRAADALLKYVYSGILGPTKGMAVDYAVMRTTDSTFVFSATLEPLDETSGPLDRYQIKIDRPSGKPSTPKKIEITNKDMKKGCSGCNRRGCCILTQIHRRGLQHLM